MMPVSTGKTQITKVSMGLTQQDIETADYLRERLVARSKAATVSEALEITRALSDIIDTGGDLLIKRKDGSIERIVIPGLTK